MFNILTKRNFLIDYLDNPCIGYCHNNGSCSVICTNSSCSLPICTCTNGYSGVQCDNMIGSVCQPNSCVNGNCVMLTNSSYQCQCFNGFLGTRCDFSKKMKIM
jgi:Notch-like protein